MAVGIEPAPTLGGPGAGLHSRPVTPVRGARRLPPQLPWACPNCANTRVLSDVDMIGDRVGIEITGNGGKFARQCCKMATGSGTLQCERLFESFTQGAPPCCASG